MATIAVIPARGGSSRIPRKNIKEFHGKPIIAYSIEKARASKLFDRIVVSTDDAEIAEVARVYGAEVWMRDPAYGADDVGTQDVVKECLIGIGALPGDWACCIYATVPLMSIQDLKAGYFSLIHDRTAVFVLSVGYPELHDVGQFYCGLAEYFMWGCPLISLRTRMVMVDSRRDCDINTIEDWDRALRMYEELKDD